MTPEQKAYKEYGKALERMNASKKELIKIWRSNENVKGRIGTALIVGPWHKQNVIDAWKKRAACRTWVRVPMNERFCNNCAHESTHPDSTPCSECFRFPFPQAYDEFDNWEPRKENEN